MPEPSPTPAQRHGMRNAIFAQCFGTLGLLAFSNGIVLLYLKALGIKSALIMVGLALPWLFESLPRIPLAYYADRHGKKRFGQVGIALTTISFLVIISAAFMPWKTAVSFFGIALYGLGFSFFISSWFGLLSPVVPETMRGRFFGRLRVSWQLVGIAFSAVCAFCLSEESPLSVFVIVLAALTITSAIRSVFYAKIPELEGRSHRGIPFIATIKVIMATNNTMAFACYSFLLMLGIGFAPSLFGLIEKDTMQLGDQAIVVLANITMVGSVAGFWLGGRAVDRWGTKPVFMCCHAGFSLMLVGFLFRLSFAPYVLIWLGLMHLGFGVAYAASSIALSSEMLALIPPENKSLSTSSISTLQRAGFALSGLLSGWALELGMLSEKWHLFGLPMTAYDSLLLVSAIFVILLIVTLGLVPSVIGSNEMPHRGP